MAGLIFLVCFVALATSVRAIPFNDQCIIRPDRLPQAGETETVTFRLECPQGEIRWDYPQGFFHVIFDPSHTDNFRLCLKGGHANFIKEMYSIVGGRKDPIQAPTEGHDSCISSHEGVVHLELVAPPPLYYVTFVPFTISVA